MRDGYGKALLTLGETNPQVVVLSADLTESTRAKPFADRYPEKFVQMGVAEQNMMGVAAGLALSGKIPFVSSYAVFSPGRNWDQLRVSVCYQNANVKVSAGHTGLGIGPDGATHQALEDIAMVRSLPNLVVLAPADYVEAEKATIAAAKHQGAVYLRLTKFEQEAVTKESDSFAIGKATVMKKGTDVTIVTCGPMVGFALEAAKDLAKEKLAVEVINCSSIKPLDVKTILTSVQKTHCLVTAEDHQVMGGMGSAVVEALATSYAAPMTEMVGMRDKFGESGKPDQLYQKYKMDKSAIIEAVKKVISRKKRL
jgi:transketolase